MTPDAPGAEVMASREMTKTDLRSSRNEPWRRREIPAWLLSVSLHTVVLGTLGITLRFAPRGVEGEPARGGGIVLAQRSDGETSYLTREDVVRSESTHASDASSALPTQMTTPLDLPGALPSPEAEATASAAGGLPSAAGFTKASTRATGLGDYGVETGVFGATGKGTRFLYVFDRSTSMDGYDGRPLAAAKAHLIRSLQDLTERVQFQIVFYNEEPRMFNPSPATPAHMMFANEETRKHAEQFVRGMRASGNTRHVPALKMALRLDPDVLFFLTDADWPPMTDEDLAQVRRLNRSSAAIHAIEFGVGPKPAGRGYMERLAHENNGQHVYVDVTRLPK